MTKKVNILSDYPSLYVSGIHLLTDGEFCLSVRLKERQLLEPRNVVFGETGVIYSGCLMVRQLNKVSNWEQSETKGEEMGIRLMYIDDNDIQEPMGDADSP